MVIIYPLSGCAWILYPSRQEDERYSSVHPETVFLPDLGVMLKKIILGISGLRLFFSHASESALT